MADTSDESISGLKSIDSKVSDKDMWLIYVILQMVVPEMRAEWT